MNIAITGGTGFIGSYLIKRLLLNNHNITILGRNQQILNNLVKEQAEVKAICIDYSYNSLKAALKNIETVIHLASKRMERDTSPFNLNEFWKTNVEMTENLLLAAHQNGIKRFCQTSSISVYSTKNSIPCIETEPAIATNIYGVSKLISENLANYYSNITQLKITNLRIARVYGNGEREGLVFDRFFKLAKEKKTLNIWSKGNSGIDYIYIKDVVSAIESAIKPFSPSGTYNIGSGNLNSIKTIANVINDFFQNTNNIYFDDTNIEICDNIFMNISKAQNELDWTPKYTLQKSLLDMLM